MKKAAQGLKSYMGMVFLRLKHFYVLSFLFFFSINAGAQLYVSPQKVLDNITVAVEIKSAVDVQYIKNNLSKFYGVQRIRVNGTADISEVAVMVELLDDLEDIQLVKYSGQLSESDLEKMEWVNNISLNLKNGREDQILMNPILGKFKGVTLIFEVVPDDYYFLDQFKSVKSLTIIAPFVAKEAKIALAAVKKLTNLKEFGISLDNISDLQPDILNFQSLEKIKVIDNLSWLTSRYYEDLPVVKKNIEFNSNGKTKYIDFQYYSSEAELYPWDIKHLYSLFPGLRFAPLTNLGGDTMEISSFADFIPLKKPEIQRFIDDYSKNALLTDFESGEYLFQGNNDEDRIYYLGKNAALLVPRNSLKGPRDSVWRGAYTLRCKWLNQPAQLFSHGASLEYDSGGVHYQISPAGLLEVQAANDNWQLSVRSGYFIKLFFHDIPDTNRHFYAWNGRKNKWYNFYDYDYEFDDSYIAPVDFYNFYASKKTAKEKFLVDKESLDSRFEQEGYFYLLPPGKSRLNLENTNGFMVAPVIDRVPAANSFVLKRGRGLIGIKKEFVDKKTESGIVKFQLFDKTDMLFPELKAFKNYVFEVSTQLLPRDFSAKFIRGAVYCDVRIDISGGVGYIELRTETGYWRFNLSDPREKYAKQPAKAKSAAAEFLKRLNKYKNIRKQKELAFQSYLSNYVQTNTAAIRASLFSQSAVPKGKQVREMRIRSMGRFTFGTPVLLPDTFSTIIRFTDQDGIPLDVKRAFIAHKFPFSYQTWGAQETYNVNLVPELLQYIACVDHKNRVYVISGTIFRQKDIANNTLIYLPVNKLPGNVNNQKELEKLLDVNLRR